MKMLRIVAAGALSYFAYKKWQGRQPAKVAKPTESISDDGGRTAPHGDPVLVGEQLDVGPTPGAGAHSSRSFGEP